MCWEQKRNGGLDKLSEVCSVQRTLWGKLTSLLVQPVLSQQIKLQDTELEYSPSLMWKVCLMSEWSFMLRPLLAKWELLITLLFRSLEGEQAKYPLENTYGEHCIVFPCNMEPIGNFSHRSCVLYLQICLNFSFTRPHSLMWNISQGCITGTPAPMPDLPSVTCVERASLESLLMACLVKVK